MVMTSYWAVDYICDRSSEIAPSLQLMYLAPLFLMWIDALIFLEKEFESVAPTQLMPWYSCAMWSVIAGLWNSGAVSFIFAFVNILFAICCVSFRCSFNLVPSGLLSFPVDGYTTSHNLYRGWHIQPHCTILICPFWGIKRWKKFNKFLRNMTSPLLCTPQKLACPSILIFKIE